MRSTLFVAVAACAVLTACGSTVQIKGQSLSSTDQGRGGSSQNGSSTTGTTDTSGTSTSGSSPVDGGSSGAVANGSTGSSIASGSTGGSSSGGSSSSGGTTGAGTGSPSGSSSAAAGRAQVGILLFPDVSAAAASLGGNAGNAGNQNAIVNTMVDYVNKNGGLGGHQLQLVVHNVSLTSSQTYAQEQQDACTDFGEDHHAVAVITASSSEDDGFPSCLQKHKILTLAGGHYLHDETDFGTVTSLVAPGEVSTTRIGKALVDQIISRNLLKSGDTLGMLTEDAPAGIRGTNKIVALLKPHGIKVIDYVIHGPDSTADISNSAAAIQSAELKMAAQGVKNVAFLCKGCSDLFLTYAESQKYFPRYLLQSIDGFGSEAGKGHTQSYKGAIALGWEPLGDVSVYSNPKLFTGNAKRDLCTSLMHKYVTDNTSESITQTVCGAFLDLKAAADTVKGKPLNYLTLMDGFNAFGPSHVSAVNFQTNVNAHRHDGAVAYRTLTYQASCDCFAYDSFTLHPFAS